jgi:hypothetical protein
MVSIGQHLCDLRLGNAADSVIVDGLGDVVDRFIWILLASTPLPASLSLALMAGRTRLVRALAWGL